MKLIFVYNADSGFFNAAADFAHKIFSPATYKCNLCAITYSNLGMKKEWKEFLGNRDEQVEFLHKNEYQKMYPDSKEELPLLMNENHNVLIAAEEMNDVKSLEDLIKRVQQVSPQ